LIKIVSIYFSSLMLGSPYETVYTKVTVTVTQRLSAETPISRDFRRVFVVGDSDSDF